MVLGYLCEDHGYQSECDTGPGGIRACPECGKEVTGLTGSRRSTSYSPPTDEPSAAEGVIEWSVITHRGNFTVDAFGLCDAVEKAINRVDNPQSISEIMPRVINYRHMV